MQVEILEKIGNIMPQYDKHSQTCLKMHLRHFSYKTRNQILTNPFVLLIVFLLEILMFATRT